MNRFKILKTYIRYKKSLFNKLVFFLDQTFILKVTSGFILGTILAYYSPILLVIPIIFLYFKIKFSSFIIVCISALLGCLNLFVWIQFNKQNQGEYINTSFNGEATVIEEISDLSNKQTFTIKIKDINDYLILTQFSKNRYYSGDKLYIKGEIKDIENFSDFDYKGYLKTERVFYEFNPKEIKLIDRSENIYSIFRQIRNGMMLQINKELTAEERMLSNGILFGDKTKNTKEFEEIFINTGTSHLLSYSGIKLIILSQILFSFAGLVNRNWLRIVSIPLFILLFFLIGGGSLGTQRAFTIIIFTSISDIFGRKSTFYISLILFVCLSLIEYPLNFLNLSLQLSLASIIGIRVFADKFKTITDRLSLRKFIKNGMNLQLAFLTSTLPFDLIYFGQISLIGILANIFIFPIIKLVLLTGYLSTVLHFGIISKILNYLYEFELRVILIIISFLNTTPFAYLNSKKIIFIFIIFFIILIVYLDYLHFKKRFNIPSINRKFVI